MPRMMLEEDLDEQTGNDTEITLGMKSLLGIFFGLVLICGVFFGFGFSMGHGHEATGSGATETAKTQATATAAEPTSTVVEEGSQEISGKSDAQPAATLPETTVPAPAVMHKPSAELADTAKTPNMPRQPQVLEAAPVTAARAVPATATITPAHTPALASAVQPATAQSPVQSAVMVQIAAVKRQQDADILVAALRKKGYTATVRTEPGNDFLHVQLGPFAGRDQAKAMRTRLLGDGYNAILK